MSPTLDTAKAEEMRKGIAAYANEQKVLLRLLRRFGQFTERDFDRWFRGREYSKKAKLRFFGISGETYLLGLGANGFNDWARWLELMQYMMALGLIDAETKDGVVVYSLCPAP